MSDTALTEFLDILAGSVMPRPLPGVPQIIYSGTNTPGTASSFNITPPASAKPGDLLMLFVVIAGGSASHITGIPTGWTEFKNRNASVDNRGAVFYRIIGSSEQQPYTWGLNDSYEISHGLIVVREVNQSNPINAHATESIGSDSSCEATSITTTVDNCLLIHFSSIGDNNVGGSTPSGMTALFDEPGIPAGQHWSAYYKSVVTASATGTLTRTYGGAGNWQAVQFAIAPFADT